VSVNVDGILVDIFVVFLSLLLLLGIGAGRDAFLLAISSKSSKSMSNDVQVVQQVLNGEVVEGEGSSFTLLAAVEFFYSFGGIGLSTRMLWNEKE